MRERIPELAVIKTVGFDDRIILGLVLSESILIMLVGGLPGLAAGWIFVQVIAEAMVAFLPGVFLSVQAMTVAVVIMLGAGVVSGIFPALKAKRLSVVEALAQP